MNLISISSGLRYPTIYINSNDSFSLDSTAKALRSGLYTEDLKLILPYNDKLHIIYKANSFITIHNKTGDNYYSYKLMKKYGFYFLMKHNMLFKFIKFENGGFR